jgi:hypothetical protein
MGPKIAIKYKRRFKPVKKGLCTFLLSPGAWFGMVWKFEFWRVSALHVHFTS